MQASPGGPNDLTLVGVGADQSTAPIGHFDGTRLGARRRAWCRNVFQTYLSAEFIATGRETQILCRFSVRLLDKVVGIVWFSGLALMVGGALIAAIIDAALYRDGTRVWPGIVFSIFMLIFGSVVAGFERHIARKDRRFLLDFITQILNARHIDAANGAAGPKL